MTAPETPGERRLTQEDLTGCAEVIATYDNALSSFIEDCELHAKSPTIDTALQLGESAKAMAKGFGSVVESIVEGETRPDNIIQEIATLVIYDDQRRCTSLRELTECKKFKAYKPTYYPTIRERLSEALMETDDTESFVEFVCDNYEGTLSNEVQHFFTHAEPADEVMEIFEEVEPLKLRVARHIGKNVLDVAKITTGVGLGILAARGYVTR